MGEIRLLHLSDLHFCTRPNNPDLVSLLRASPMSACRVYFFRDRIFRFATHRPQLALSLAEFVYTEQAGLDAIVITGDLATTGTAGDLAVAAGYVLDPCTAKWLTRMGTPGLLSHNLPIFSLPGNHDRYQDTRGTPGGGAFDDAFPSWPKGSKVHKLVLAADDGELLAIIGADFSLRFEGDAGFPQALLRYGQGRAYADTIDELKRETLRVREGSPAAVIWAMHFPPSIPQEAIGLAFLDGAQIAAAAVDCGVKYVLAGHVHERCRYRIGDGTCEVLCASSSTTVSPEPNELHVLSVELKDGAVRRLMRRNHRYDFAAQTFA